VVLIVGFGPTGTRYVEQSADPRTAADHGSHSE